MNLIESKMMSDTEKKPLRSLFCIAINQNFHDLSQAEMGAVAGAFIAAVDDLKGRFGITVLGTFDDDQLSVGAAISAPWTAYILADVPDLDTVIAVCNLWRTWPALDGMLWKYSKIEARVGRALFAGNS
jgi:hypothetical protein